MEQSILTSTKKVLGIAPDYTAFDLDILTHINAVFGTLAQLGIDLKTGFALEDDTVEWADAFAYPVSMIDMIKTYVYLRVRYLFDPPTTSFHLTAMKEQIQEHEWRLSTFREGLIP